MSGSERSKHKSRVNRLAIWEGWLSIIINTLLFGLKYWVGITTASIAIIADGWHHRSDAIASTLILIGILFGRYFWWIDGVLGIAVSLVIFWATFDILRNSVSSLIGEQPDAELMGNLRNLVSESVAHDVDLHHLHLHQYGQHKELTFHISLPRDLKLRETHSIANNLETLIHERLGLETTIHVDPREQAEKD